MLTLFISILDKNNPQKHLTNHETAFNIHNSHLHHRDRSTCGFLLTSKSKASRGQIMPNNSSFLREALPMLASGNSTGT
jgi:hypothetical protein